jgi:carbonic anhydrase
MKPSLAWAPLCAAALASLGGLAAAREAAAPAASAASAAASAVPVLAPGASAPPVADTLELLNRRLAEKLGSVRQPTKDGSILLKVPSRNPTAPVPKRSSPATHVAKAASAAPNAVASAPAGTEDRPLHGLWSYDGPTGPQAWSRLDPDFAVCNRGLRQSPIDVHDGIRVQLEPIEVNYKPSTFGVIDNGHTVQVNLAPGNFINVLGRRYALQQFHFHRPSEHRLDGKAYEMEAHLVHRDDEGRLAVIAVLLDRGVAQPVVQTVWNNLPLEKGEEQPARVLLNPADLLPKDRRYATFIGSLTTPPCSEGVLWMVMKQPGTVSDAQAAIFARLYPMNARPVQPASGRLIKESE